MDAVARAIGQMEQATKDLNENITGLRREIKTLSDGISIHHDKLKDGEYEFKRQKISNKVVLGWLIFLTVMNIPGLQPWLKLVVGKLF